MNQKNLIYALTCPRCGCPRYVGQTTKGRARFADHLKGKEKDGSIHKKRWVQGLLDQDEMPGFVVLASLPTPEQLDAAEIFWIQEMKARGCPLTNLTDGGGGLRGYKQSPEHVAKRAAATKGIPKSPEHRAKISTSLMGRPSPKKGRPLALHEVEAHARAHAIEPFHDQHGRVYTSLKEAAQRWGLSPGNICMVLQGKRKSTGGLIFSRD